jgi:hypothetical protein
MNRSVWCLVLFITLTLFGCSDPDSGSGAASNPQANNVVEDTGPSPTEDAAHDGDTRPEADVEESGCSNGEVEKEPCGLNNRGWQERTCSDGTWDTWSGCEDPDECTDGATESVDCEAGTGEVVRSCTDGTWSMPDCPQPQDVLIVSYEWGEYQDETVLTFQNAGYTVDRANDLPTDLVPYRLIIVNQPNSALDAADLTRLRTLLNQKRRIVLVGDHCKYGCFVDTDSMHRAFAALGFEATYDGELGNKAEATLVKPHRLTQGVASLMFSWSGGIKDLGAGVEPLAVTDDASSDVIMAVERPSFVTGTEWGDVVVVSDLDFFSAANSTAFDNSRLLLNLLEVP